MKNKFFAIVAASTTVMLWTPVQAQITGTPQNLNLTISVPEVLYLRTAKNISIALTATDFSNNTTLTQVGTGSVGFDSANTTATSNNTGGVSLATPFNSTTGNTISISKSIPQVYAVWSNSPRNQGIRVTMGISNATLSGPQGSSGTITKVTTTLNGATSSIVNTTAPGLITPAFGPANLDIAFGGSQTAGDYTGGVITVQAEAP